MITVAVIVLLWVACGLYAKSIERAVEDPAPTPLLLALLKGPLSMREALIFSTLTMPPALLDEPLVVTAAADRERPAPPPVNHVTDDDRESADGSAADQPAFTPTGFVDFSTLPDGLEVVETQELSIPAEAETPAPVAPSAADPVQQDLSERPAKLPRRPLAGTVKVRCPVCREQTKHARDAVCKRCEIPNRWLTEAWGLDPVAVPAAPVAAPATVEPPVEEAAIVSSATVPHELSDRLEGFEPAADPVSTVELSAEAELEAYDKLPSRPRLGKVKTVCPTCHQRTKHDRDGVCQSCGQPNDWLRKRWDLLAADTQLRFEPAPEPAADQPPEVTAGAEVVPFVASPSRVGRCGGCGRRAYADRHGNCAFCNTPLGEEALR